MAGAIFVPFVLQTLHMSTLAAGAGALVGSLLAARLGERFGVGPVMIACQAITGIGFALVAVAPVGWLAWISLGLGQFTIGFSIGAENGNTLGYRQAVTPDAMQGRMNATMRSINRAMLVFAAPLGGLLADAIGYRQALWVAVAGFVLVALSLSVTPMRDARIDRDPA